MRELGRRLKKTVYGWSDKGATKIIRIILKRFTSANEWEQYWQDKMNYLDNVIVSVRNYKVFFTKFRTITFDETGKIIDEIKLTEKQ